MRKSAILNSSIGLYCDYQSALVALWRFNQPPSDFWRVEKQEKESFIGLFILEDDDEIFLKV